MNNKTEDELLERRLLSLQHIWGVFIYPLGLIVVLSFLLTQSNEVADPGTSWSISEWLIMSWPLLILLYWIYQWLRQKEQPWWKDPAERLLMMFILVNILMYLAATGLAIAGLFISRAQDNPSYALVGAALAFAILVKWRPKRESIEQFQTSRTQHPESRN